ncbi:MAG: hypothetical protein WED32_01680 [Patescibacteria group bacterium]
MPSLARTFIGVPAGFAATAVLSIATTTLLRFVWPMLGQQGQGGALELLDGAYALLYMGVGAYVAAKIGQRRAGYALTIIFGLLGIVTALTQADAAHSAAYQWALASGAWPLGVAGTRLGAPRSATVPR